MTLNDKSVISFKRYKLSKNSKTIKRLDDKTLTYSEANTLICFIRDLIQH